MPVVKKYSWCVIIIILICPSLKGWCQSVESGPLSVASSRDSVAPLPEDTNYKRPSFVISQIFISGNIKTKPYIIQRELPFKIGDSVYLPDLVKGFRRARELLINTRLFNDVIVALKSFHGNQVDVTIEVRERWYIFPIPYFKPVDRNLQAWADNNYALSRVNYGLKFSHNNFTGRNDKLRLWLITGYTKQVQLNYDQPYADKSLKHGFGLGVFYSALKELNLATVNNQQVFLNADSIAFTGKYLTEQYNFNASYYYRPAIKTRHTLRFSMNYFKIDSVVTAKSPFFFNENKLKIVYPEFSYDLDYQDVDYVPYVLRGFLGNINLLRRGFNSDMNLWQASGRFTVGAPLGGKYYFGLQGYGTIKLPLTQPYFNQRLFGYGDTYLRGLEKYVVDGVAGVLFRSTFRKQLFSFSFGTGIPTLQRVPVKIYIKAYNDLGYSYNPNFRDNSLVNTLLYTAGTGIDIVTAYDLVLRFEYDWNQLGEHGLFFHIKNDF